MTVAVLWKLVRWSTIVPNPPHPDRPRGARAGSASSVSACVASIAGPTPGA